MVVKKGTNQINEALLAVTRVASVQNVTIEEGMIEKISLKSRAIGNLTLQRLRVRDAEALFDFYFNGLSEQSRNFWLEKLPRHLVNWLWAQC